MTSTWLAGLDLWASTNCDDPSAVDRLYEIVERLVSAEREACAAKTREFAAHYPEGSDGRNTFIMLAEWIERRAARIDHDLRKEAPVTQRCADCRMVEDTVDTNDDGPIHWCAATVPFWVPTPVGDYNRWVKSDDGANCNAFEKKE